MIPGWLSVRDHRFPIAPYLTSTSAVRPGRFHGASLFATVALVIECAVRLPAYPQASSVLTGQGDHVPLGPVYNSFADDPIVTATIQETPFTRFTGTWGSTAPPAWRGTFTAEGPIPVLASRPAGQTTYDFAGLANGVLPAGSYLFMSGLDSGSGPERITLVARDLKGAVITSPWLNAPALGEAGVEAGFLEAMPGWDWDLSAPNAYTFTGDTVLGNPTIKLALANNRDVAVLEVTRNSSFCSFGVTAPSSIPEPSTLALMAVGLSSMVVVHRVGRSRSSMGSEVK